MAITCRATGAVHAHETVAEVKDCYDWKHYVDSGQAEADARAELAAEEAYERSFEDRGWAEAAAFADWEASRGLLSYEEARDLAGA